MEHATTRILHSLFGVSLAMGLLVLLNQLQIPYYLYYPRTTQTVLISESYDLYLFLISSLCVPVGLALVSRKISKSGLVGILVIWAASFVLTILREPVAVPTLLVTVACAAALTVSKADLRQSSIMEIISSTLVILLLIESSTVFYWIGAALNPQGRVGILS